MTPEAPTVTEVCGPDNDEVHLPTVEGVAYDVSDWEDGTATVTATAEPGYEFADDAETSWEFTDTNEPCEPSPSPTTDEPSPGDPSPTPDEPSPSPDDPAPSPDDPRLPRTGGSVTGPLAIGAMLMVIGGLSIILMSRRTQR